MISTSIDAINQNKMDELEFRKIALQDLHLIKEKLEIQEKKKYTITDDFELQYLNTVTLYKMKRSLHDIV